ncbi:MAG: tetratricopeptide repeat protein [Chrysiogenetes bacterium]|nr:tetratricopeptide repeat protein [Chrysiogenetes bacterium]
MSFRSRSLAAALALAALIGACTSGQRIDFTFYLAHRALRKGDAERAAELYYKAFEMDPEGEMAPEALYEYARTIDVHQRLPGFAVEVYRRGSRLFPETNYAVIGLERAAEIEIDHLKHPERAVLDYTRLLNLYPEHERRYEWMLHQAEGYARLGNPQQAETELRALIEIKELPDQVRVAAKSLLGEMLLVLERPGEAATVYESLAAWTKDRPGFRAAWLEARYDLAQALSELDETERALEIYRDIEGEFPRQEVIQEKINFLTIRLSKRNR